MRAMSRGDVTSSRMRGRVMRYAMMPAVLCRRRRRHTVTPRSRAHARCQRACRSVGAAVRQQRMKVQHARACKACMSRRHSKGIVGHRRATGELVSARHVCHRRRLSPPLSGVQSHVQNLSHAWSIRFRRVSSPGPVANTSVGRRPPSAGRPGRLAFTMLRRRPRSVAPGRELSPVCCRRAG